MNSRIITKNDIHRIVAHIGINRLMVEMIQALRDNFYDYNTDRYVVFTRKGFTYHDSHPGLIEWMPIMKKGENVTIKVVGYHPGNPLHYDLPTIISTIFRYDIKTGHLIYMMDGTFLTALRTGASSALASEILAMPESKILGLIGCGAQAITQAHALTRLFKFEQILIFDIDNETTANFHKRAAFLDIKIINASLERIVRESDILVTATSVEIGKGPVFTDIKKHKSWLHINAVGSDFPGKFEIPISLLKRSFVTPDFLEQARCEGECQQLEAADIGPDLHVLVKNQESYKRYCQALTVFDSTGWALEDYIGTDIFYKYADMLSIGESMAVEDISEEIRNPYYFLESAADLGKYNINLALR